MKVALAYSLLFVYAIALLKPVLPQFTDWFSHTFVLHQHLATVHHHHGHDHVEKEMAQEADHHDNKPEAPATPLSEPVAVHLQTVASHLPLLPAKELLFWYAIHTESLYSILLSLDVPPPRC